MLSPPPFSRHALVNVPITVGCKWVMRLQPALGVTRCAQSRRRHAPRVHPRYHRRDARASGHDDLPYNAKVSARGMITPATSAATMLASDIANHDGDGVLAEYGLFHNRPTQTLIKPLFVQREEIQARKPQELCF